MDKTKEEIRKETEDWLLNHPISKGIWKYLGGSGRIDKPIYSTESVRDILEEYGTQCRKEGFEAFRAKAEEWLKNERSYSVETSDGDKIYSISLKSIFVAIKEIKQ